MVFVASNCHFAMKLAMSPSSADGLLTTLAAALLGAETGRAACADGEPTVSADGLGGAAATGAYLVIPWPTDGGGGTLSALTLGVKGKRAGTGW